MKLVSIIPQSVLPLLALWAVAARAADGDDGHDDHGDDHLLCADVNVTDAATCATWCGLNKQPEWTYYTEHGDFEEFHVDYLEGWSCHCEPVESGTTANAEEEVHCDAPYELPTCESMGLADCGANATMTCAELCESVGLGLPNSTTVTLEEERRFLSHVEDTHFCAHHEHQDHEHRRLEGEEEDHHDEEPVTICYCNAKEEAAADSTVACSDADLTEGHAPHGSGSYNVVVGGVSVVAMLLVGFSV